MVKQFVLYHAWHFPLTGPVNSRQSEELAGRPKPTAPRH